MKPLSHRIYLLGQAMAVAADKLLRDKFGLGFTEYLALHGIGNKRLTSQAELTGFTGAGTAGVSRIVTRLETRGLIDAKPDPANRRRNLLSLTPAGTKLFERAATHLEQRFVQSAAAIASSEDQETFERVLDALLSKMSGNS
jgi:DNA-binding MarR family transcriptional regulator